jgi:16S rRNA G966 N2-methylase RsmD
VSDEYAPFAEIYDAWVGTAQFGDRHVPFYVDEFVKAGGPCVELGVGNGRITIEAARRGVDITGVEVSAAMRALCLKRAHTAGVAHKLRLVASDMRNFRLPKPASAIAIPFSTIGHVISLEEKAALCRHVASQLVRGGLFLFDSMVFDPKYAAANQNVARLRSEHADLVTGEALVTWSTATYDHPKQGIRIIAWTDRIGSDGISTTRRYTRMDFSWVTPAQVRNLLEESGFLVEACYGSFDRAPLVADSKTQIWFARKV